MTSSRPRLVVFDLGGVLVRIARSWSEACAAAGLPVRGEADTPDRIAARRPWVFAYELGRIDHAAFVAGVADATGGLYAPEEVARIHEAWLLSEYDGVPGVLDALEQAEIDTGILSNTNAAHWSAQMFRGPGRASRFPTLARVRHRHASHLLGVRKPQPEAFAGVEAATGVSGTGILFFDDLEENVAGARRAGWQAEPIDPRGDPASQMLAHLAARDVRPR